MMLNNREIGEIMLRSQQGQKTTQWAQTTVTAPAKEQKLLLYCCVALNGCHGDAEPGEA